MNLQFNGVICRICGFSLTAGRAFYQPGVRADPSCSCGLLNYHDAHVRARDAHAREVEEKAQAQARHAAETGAPMFAPQDGVCYFCGKQIFDAISLEKASTRLITGCPCCSRTYCD